MSTDASRHRAFTLTEVMISASIGVVFIAMFLAIIASVSKWYRSSAAKADYAEQIKLLDMRVRPDCAGVGYFEIFDDYPTRAGNGGKKANPNIERGGNMVVLAQVNYATPLSTNPTITRLIGYYADLSTEEATPATPASTRVNLRRFDSGDLATRAASADAELNAWRTLFPATLNFADPTTNLASLLPPASRREAWPVIAKLDVGAIKLARDSRQNGTKDDFTGLTNQIFYPRPGILMMNAPLRYGSGDEAYIAPLTLSFNVHQ